MQRTHGTGSMRLASWPIRWVSHAQITRPRRCELGSIFSALGDSGYRGPVCIEVEDRVYEGSLENRQASLVQSERTCGSSARIPISATPERPELSSGRETRRPPETGGPTLPESAGRRSQAASARSPGSILLASSLKFDSSWHSVPLQ